MKRLLIVIGIVMCYGTIFSQSTSALPLQTFTNSDASKPLIFYISGDGGMNKFSTSLLKSINAKGYSIVALDARNYFWNKKAPQQAANDISSAINQYLNKWQRKNFIIIGYSFGADVLPFIYNRFSKEVQQKTNQLVLLSPSTKTDFEIHVSGILGLKSDKGENVPAEINKLTKPVLLVFGKGEDDFPLNQVVIKNKQVLIMPGGHHYDSDTGYLSNELLARMK